MIRKSKVSCRIQSVKAPRHERNEGSERYILYVEIVNDNDDDEEKRQISIDRLRKWDLFITSPKVFCFVCLFFI